MAFTAKHGGAISGHRSEQPGEPMYVRAGGNVSLITGAGVVSRKCRTRSVGSLSLLGTFNYLQPLSFTHLPSSLS